jgi:hypothetical protein
MRNLKVMMKILLVAAMLVSMFAGVTHVFAAETIELSEINEHASDLTFEGLTVVESASQYDFTMKIKSGKVRTFAYFNPPDGNKIKVIMANKIKAGSNEVKFSITKAKLKGLDMITFNVSGVKEDNFVAFNTSQLPGFDGGSSDSGESSTTTVSDNIDKIVASEQAVTIGMNQTMKLKIYALYVDGKEVDVTTNKATTYRSSSASVASMTAGLLKSGSAGSATITVTYNGKKVDLPITVVAADVKDIVVSPKTVKVTAGDVKQLKVDTIDSKNVRKDVTDEASYFSNDTSVATVEDGEIVGVAKGETTVVVNYLGKEQNVTVEVSDEAKLEVDKLEASEKSIKLKVGQQQEIYIYAVYSDGSKDDVTGEVLFQSSKGSVATIVDGIVTAKGVGSSTLKATLDGVEVSVKATVEKAKKLKSLAVSNPSLSINEGGTATIKVTATYVDNTKEDVTSKVIWTIGNTDVVDVKSGKFYALDLGKTVVKGKFDGKLVSVNVTVK